MMVASTLAVQTTLTSIHDKVDKLQTTLDKIGSGGSLGCALFWI
jgi:hypothetical protein